VGLRLELHLDNLVDKIWHVEEGRPPYPSDPLFILNASYAGKFLLKVLPAITVQLELRVMKGKITHSHESYFL
jgi:hypothetical protein